MTRDQVVALVRAEVVPLMTRELEEQIQRGRAEAELNPALLREGVTLEDVPVLIEVAAEFVEHVKAWRATAAERARPPRQELALALWELLPLLADAARMLKEHGEEQWGAKVLALIDRHWALGTEGAQVALSRRMGNHHSAEKGG